MIDRITLSLDWPIIRKNVFVFSESHWFTWKDPCKVALAFHVTLQAAKSHYFHCIGFLLDVTLMEGLWFCCVSGTALCISSTLHFAFYQTFVPCLWGSFPLTLASQQPQTMLSRQRLWQTSWNETESFFVGYLYLE